MYEFELGQNFAYLLILNVKIHCMGLVLIKYLNSPYKVEMI